MDDATSWDSISDDEACSPHADVINDGAPTVFAQIKISSENLQLFRFVPSVVFVVLLRKQRIYQIYCVVLSFSRITEKISVEISNKAQSWKDWTQKQCSRSPINTL